MCRRADSVPVCMYAKPQAFLCDKAWTEHDACIPAAWVCDQAAEILPDTGNEAVSHYVQRIAYCAVIIRIVQQDSKEVM